MNKISKRANNILKNIKPLQEDLQKRRAKMEKKKQETDRISFIRNEIKKHANENDEKCKKFIDIQREIANEYKTIPEKKLLLTNAMDIFSQICTNYTEIATAFFEARGAEGLAQTFEALLDTVILDLLQKMFADDFSLIFEQLFNTSDKPQPNHEEIPAP